MERPVTSKSRGVCRYYKEPRGCFSGDKCKFLHGEPEETEIKFTPFDQAKTCRYYAQGFCKRGDKCWFKHTAPKARTSKGEEEEELCSICFDRPVTYGLLMGCTHVFCITCIKEWRDSAKKNNQGGILKVTKLCPMCRAPSKYITPSSLFYKHDDPRKEQVVTAYKESMARIPCRYFQRTKGDSTKKPFCPFGKDCFYQHLNADGTSYVFSDGVDVCMRVSHITQRTRNRTNHCSETSKSPNTTFHLWFLPTSIQLSQPSRDD
ncbi:hypothetical protein BDZ89DRAFT_942718 [Hymenopellis radicata]|nr:hypothetical protein BDZ89DRAFT_942718 [Hymenopellis radicata]